MIFLQALGIDFGDYSCLYYFPDGMDGIEDWTDYINSCEEQFVPMTILFSSDTVFPFFIDENCDTQYINLAAIKTYHETEIEVMSRDEYEQRLAECVSAICPDCVYYEEDTDGDNLTGHRDEMRLDGFCPRFTRRDESDNPD